MPSTRRRPVPGVMERFDPIRRLDSKLLLLAIVTSSAAADETWHKLAPLPDEHGVADGFARASSGVQ